MVLKENLGIDRCCLFVSETKTALRHHMPKSGFVYLAQILFPRRNRRQLAFNRISSESCGEDEMVAFFQRVFAVSAL